jgi:hypothetical protein
LTGTFLASPGGPQDCKMTENKAKKQDIFKVFLIFI